MTSTNSNPLDHYFRDLVASHHRDMRQEVQKELKQTLCAILEELMAIKQAPQQKLLLTEEEAAEVLNETPQTLATMRRDGTGPRYARKSPRSKPQYPMESLQAWVKNNSYNNTSEESAKHAEGNSKNG